MRMIDALPVKLSITNDLLFAISSKYLIDRSTTVKETEEVKTTTLDYTAEFLGSVRKQTNQLLINKEKQNLVFSQLNNNYQPRQRLNRQQQKRKRNLQAMRIIRRMVSIEKIKKIKEKKNI